MADSKGPAKWRVTASGKLRFMTSIWRVNVTRKPNLGELAVTGNSRTC